MVSLKKNVTVNVCYSTGKMKRIVFLLAVLAAAACTKDKTPEIPQEQMVDVLYDLTLASSTRSLSSKRDTVQYLVPYKDVLKKHGIDSLRFAKAQLAYQENPDLYAAIYDSVYKRLQKKLEETRALPADKEEEVKTPELKIRDLPFSHRKE